MKLVHNVQKKQHRERAQPTERKKLGLLEKKKDYQLRAKDFHRKEDALKLLRQRAAARNPDEYYHAMTSRKTDNQGVIITERDEEQLTADQIKLLKTQDATYIKNLRNEESKKLKKLENNLSYKSSGKHTVFVDSVKDKLEFDSIKFFGTDKNLIGNRENRLRLDQLSTKKELVKQYSDDDESKEKLDEERLKKYDHLKRVLKKTKELQDLDERMNYQRDGFKSGSKSVITDANGRKAFRFKKERKR